MTYQIQKVKKVRILFSLIFCMSCFVFFQNCGSNLTDEENGPGKNGSSFSSEQSGASYTFSHRQVPCQIHNITMNADSIEFQVNDFKEKVQLDWEDDTEFSVDDSDLEKYLNNFHICAVFPGDVSEAFIDEFTANSQTDLTVTASEDEEVSIKLSVNSDTEDDGNLRLLSFTSVKKQSKDDSCQTLKPKLHKVKLNADDDIVLSSDSNVACESVESGTGGNYNLSCTYAADQPGCVFKMTLLAYDSDDVLFTERKVIQITMEEEEED